MQNKDLMQNILDCNREESRFSNSGREMSSKMTVENPTFASKAVGESHVQSDSDLGGLTDKTQTQL